MSDQVINGEIAKACGWKSPDDCTRTPSHKWKSPLDGCCYDAPPDYVNDLNAMHSATAILSHEALLEFDRRLFDICGSRQKCVHATARQRAESFLKTIGKWKP